MPLWIALLRGINIGGHHKLPMNALTALLTQLGGHEIRTYIQSGNVIFRHPANDRRALAQTITAAIARSHGFAPHVLLLTRDELEQALTANPFSEGEDQPKSLHLFFLDQPPPAPDLASLEGVRAPSERFALIGDRFYLHAPEGVGRSKLVAKVERALGVAATARNWNTCRTMREWVQAAD